MTPKTESESSRYAVHLSSRILSSRISSHRFRLDHAASIFWRPTEHVTIKFPTDFDPTDLSNKENVHVMSFTPCGPIETSSEDGLAKQSSDISEETDLLGEQSNTNTTSSNYIPRDFEILSSRGRIGSLIGLPRFKPLRIEILDHGGGFSAELITRNHETVMIAGGTGIAPFLALPLGLRAGKSMIWCINDIDSELVNAINLTGFRTIQYFLSPSEGNNNKPPRKQRNIFSRRIEQADFQQACHSTNAEEILYCGGKALEWQIKWWALSIGKTITTISRPKLV